MSKAATIEEVARKLLRGHPDIELHASTFTVLSKRLTVKELGALAEVLEVISRHVPSCGCSQVDYVVVHRSDCRRGA